MFSNELQIVVGLGKTGLSVVRFLKQRGYPVMVVDSREQPPELATLKANFSDVPVVLGTLQTEVYTRAKRIILSPGISRQLPEFQKAFQQSIPMVGDIELFAETARAPVIAITGTNAKSTVTALLGEMIQQAGYNVRVGGNIGTPALDLLTATEPDFYVLELSSFQLETTFSLLPRVATILNITPDHLDRYTDLAAYTQAKHRIYKNCAVAVWNRDDVQTKPHSECETVTFGLDEPTSGMLGLRTFSGITYLAMGEERLLPVDTLSLTGQHNWANALACLAMGHAIELPLDSMLKTLQTFAGLAHRCQRIRTLDGVTWYDDSKATNVGAAIASIEGVSRLSQGKIILIAGGLSKGVSFESLQSVVLSHVRQVMAIGEDKGKLHDALHTIVPVHFATDMAEAVQLARQLAQPGDAVLLAPACASFDMFKDYAHRGEVFIQCVNQLSAS